MFGRVVGVIAVIIALLLFSPYGSLFFTVSSIISIWFLKDIPPGLVAIPCGISGVVILFARYSAWKAGVAQQGLSMLKDSPKAYKQAQGMEALYISTGLFNIIIFCLFIFKKF